MKTETLTQRTQGEWKVSKENIFTVVDKNGYSVAIMTNRHKVAEEEGLRTWAANAAYICKAVNNHEALLSALKAVTKEYEYAIKLIAEAGGFEYTESYFLKEAKEKIKQAEL